MGRDKPTEAERTRWDDVAARAWEKILLRMRRLRDEDWTLQQIADRMGAKSRGGVAEWLNENQTAERTAFATLMNYMDRLGIDYRSVFPNEDGEIPMVDAYEVSQENELLRKKIQELEKKIIKQEGAIEALRGTIISQAKSMAQTNLMESSQKEAV